MSHAIHSRLVGEKKIERRITFNCSDRFLISQRVQI